MCKTARGNLLCNAGSSALGPCQPREVGWSEGWDGVRGGREVQEGRDMLRHFVVGQKTA